MQEFESFSQFYPYYLSEHQQPLCRALHYCGSTLVLLILAWLVQSGLWQFVWLLPLAGYGFAWVGHFLLNTINPLLFNTPGTVWRRIG